MALQFVTEQLKDGLITTIKVGDLQITGAKIADATIANGKIIAGTIANDRLVNDEISLGGVVTALGGVYATPAFNLSAATLLPVSTGISGLGSGVASLLATFSSANLATAVTDETGTGALVFATSPTLVTPVLGTPASGTLDNCTTGTPANPSDLANKAYVDSTSAGLDVKESVRVATTSGITLSGTQTIDGVAIVADDRVLVKDQTSNVDNGIYICASGSWTRSLDFAAGDNESGAFTFVEAGTTFIGSGFVCTMAKGDVVATDPAPWSRFSEATQIQAGIGLAQNGNDFDVQFDDVQIGINGSDQLEIKDASIVNAKISATAAIALSKLASGATAQLIVANSASGVPTYVDLSGDAVITALGGLSVISVQADAIATASIEDNAVVLAKVGWSQAYETTTVSGSSTTIINLANRLNTNADRMNGGNVVVYLNGQALDYKATPSATYSEYKVTDDNTNTLITFGAAVPDGSVVQVRYIH